MRVDVYSAELENKEPVKGFLILNRKYLGGGTYSNVDFDYLICVNEITMPDSVIRGCFNVDKKTLCKNHSITIECTCENSLLDKNNPSLLKCVNCGKDIY